MPSDEFVRDCFGEDAKIAPLFFGGRRVTCQFGRFELESRRGLRNVAGGARLYECIVRMAHELWGSVMVEGDALHVRTAMAAGRQLGIEVIPHAEVPRIPSIAVGGAVFAALTGLAYVFFPLLASAVAGLMMTLIAMAFIDPLLDKDVWDRASLEGRKYWESFPDANTPRGAPREEAKRKGFI